MVLNLIYNALRRISENELRDNWQGLLSKWIRLEGVRCLLSPALHCVVSCEGAGSSLAAKGAAPFPGKLFKLLVFHGQVPSQ